MGVLKIWREVTHSFCEYDTPMIVHIKNRTVGVINRFIQLVIIGYVIGYAIIYEKGYQEFDEVKSAITTKVKGIMYEKYTEYGQQTWDVADYVIPPQETNALFVVTGVVQTFMQTQGNCPEDPYIKEAVCQNDSQCERQQGVILLQGHGPFTGKCVPSHIIQKQNVCEIFGWCPVENDNPSRMSTFNESANFTVYIKNNIEFPKFGVIKRNIMQWYKTESELSECRWKNDDPKDKYCPIFILGDILKSTDTDYSSILKTGAIIKIIIDWTCNLDYSLDYCLPEYSFRRLDRGNNSISKGFNFRFADHFMIKEANGTSKRYRNLYKVAGIHFLFEVRGYAGQFSIVPLVYNIGSGMALLGIASVVCDIIVLYFLKARALYKRKKFMNVSAGVYEEFKNEPNDTSRTNDTQHTSLPDSQKKLTEEDKD